MPQVECPDGTWLTDTTLIIRHFEKPRPEPAIIREVFVYYRDGMGTSKLGIPAAKGGTARNVNTVTALVKLASRG